MAAASPPENSGDCGSPGEIRQLSAGLPPAGLTGLFIDYKIFFESAYETFDHPGA